MNIGLRKLRVKIKSLGSESRIIRQEEIHVSKEYRRKRNPELSRDREELYLHKRDVVRPELRASYLAYAFLRGRGYAQVERKANSEPDIKKIVSNVNRFSTIKVDEGSIVDWLNGVTLIQQVA